MSDSFADLWSSSAPKQKPQTLAAASSSFIQSSASRPTSKPDAFSFLAQHSRPTSTAGKSGKRSITNTPPVPPPSVPSASRGAPRTGVDAFSDLFSNGSSNGSAKSQTGLTLAERLALEARAKDTRTVGAESQLGSDDSAWLGLDSLAKTGRSDNRSRSNTDDWGLVDFAVQTPLSHPQPRKQSSLKPAKLWDLQDFASTTSSSSPHSSRPASSSQQSTIFDASSGLDNSNNITIQGPQAGRGLLDLDDDDAPDFDLGLRLVQDHPNTATATATVGGDDDILGMLSQPVEVVKAQTQTRNLTSSPIVISNQPSLDNLIPSTNNKPPKTKSTSSSPPSPPPHILGQIVEMGFSVQQAKTALSNTRDGKDVQEALDALLGGGSGSGSGSGGEVRPEDNADSGRGRAGEVPPVRRGAPKGFRERERERVERMRRERETSSGIPPTRSDTDVVLSDVQEQADRLLSQASEIGLSVLSKASAFWKEKKERVARVYEERAGSGGIMGVKERGDGEPRWGVRGGFRDDEDDEEERRIHGTATTTNNTQEAGKRARRVIEPQSRLESEEVDLFITSTGPLNHSIPASNLFTESPVPPPPITTRERSLPTASPSTLSAVNDHRKAGNAQFKLGQYAGAIESYGKAIGVLPAGHLLLVPLLNERAGARMRTGEYGCVVDDAGRVLGIVLGGEDGFGGGGGGGEEVGIEMGSWRPEMEPPFLLAAAQRQKDGGGWMHPQGFGVDLADGYVKALHCRAEASEGREKWAEALKFWEVLLSFLTSTGSVDNKEQLRRGAERSAARCRKMMMMGSTEDDHSKKAGLINQAKPKPKPRSTQTTSTAPSAALRSLQATTAQTEAEENLKHQLKDSVDAKVAAWRTGKESNIRALLASLDMVLWEDVGGGGVRVGGGLHELVSPVQVKKGYVRAIGRVHPDKLNAKNSTVEQRMLANAVFGTLSEAWTCFQNTNGV